MTLLLSPPAQAQTTNHEFAIPERSTCVQLLPFSKCQCASLAMKTTQEDAFSPLWCQGGRLGCDWEGTDRPEISPNSSQANWFMQPQPGAATRYFWARVFISGSSGDSSNALKHLRGKLEKQPTVVSCANQQNVFLTVHQCVDAWWLISLLIFPLLSHNCESSH